MRYTHEEQMSDLTRSIGRLASGRLCSPTPTQYAIRPALEGDVAFLNEFKREIRKRRDFVVSAVSKIERLSCDVPAAAFYVMIKADDPLKRPDEEFVLDLLERTGVLVVPGSGFGADPGQGLFRLVYLPDEQVLSEVFHKISRCLEGSRRDDAPVHFG
jgi:alanine-synthesizing transaminase